LAPGWFENTANTKRAELLMWAKSGAERPSSTSKNRKERQLAQILNDSRKLLNREYYTQIRTLRPDWFRKFKKK
jgi:hypothetical protein